MKHVNLEEFAQGKLSAQLNKELKRVTENIQDPNTDPTKERKITVTIKIKPNNERNYGSCAIETKFVPVPELGTITGLTFGKDIRTGEVDMMEVMNQIPGQMSVRLISGLDKERDREELFRVTTNPNGFSFDNYYEQERFIINMQTAFQQSDETALILTVAGNVENKTVANYGDDGTSQKATISKGIAGKEDVIVPNPVTLKPYRTFLEVDQPESKFIFRIGEAGDGSPLFKLVEADGGIWKYDAVDQIKAFIKSNLKPEFSDSITIIG